MSKVKGKMPYAYTTEHIVKVLKMYEKNSNNLKKTERDSGVSRPTIRRWVEQFGKQVFNHNHMEDVVYKINENLVERRTKMLTRTLEAKEKFLEKIIERIEFTNEMDSLTRGFKIITEIDRAVKGITDDGDEDVGQNGLGVINIITDQLNLIKNELKIN